MQRATSLSYPWARLRGRALARALSVVAGAGLIALSARLAIPLPFSPVPVTGQTLAVLALAGLMGRRSAASVGLYLFGAALGLPLLAGQFGGLARLLGPTGGYLAGFVVGAYVAGWLAEGSTGRPGRLALALVSGQALIYGCGLLGLSRFVAADRLLLAGLYPFLVGDACKLVLSYAIACSARAVNQARPARAAR